MTTTFTGEVRIPGAIENGLPSTITLDAQTLILTAGGTELGRWNRTDLALSRDPDGTFRLTLGTEIVLFNPDSPLEFAILSGMPATASPPVGAPSGPAIPTPAPVAAPPPAATAAAPPVAPAPSPASGTPPPGAAPPPAPAVPPAVAPPDAAPPPADAVPPTTAVPPSPAAPPSPAIPVPTGTAPATPVPPVAATPPPATAPTPATPPGAAPPAAATPTTPPPADVVSAGAPAAAARATVPGQPAAPANPADIRLETDSGQEAAPAAPSAQPTEFWDGFHAEADEAAGGSKSDTQPAEGEVADTGGSEFQLESAAEDGDEEATGAPKVTGYGSGLFTEDDDTPHEYPPAFEGAGDEAGDEAGEERAWSYDDPAPHDPESPDPTPAFTSPAADREDLVPSSKGSGIAALLAWRPSMPGRPSFSFGASGIGMRAREALSVLDSILEENGTEDIPKGLIVGLFVFVGLLALVAVVVAIL